MTEDKKKKGIDPESLLGDMDNMERYNGTTKEKIVDNWYELKRQVLNIILAGRKDEEKKH